jgi:hypothetical protein
MSEDLEISMTVPFFFNDTVNCIVSMCHMANGRVTEWWTEEGVEGSSCGLQKPRSNTARLWTTQTWSWSADYENANFSPLVTLIHSEPLQHGHLQPQAYLIL